MKKPSLIIVALFLSACAAFTAPKSTEQQVYYALASVTSARETTQALLERNRITVAQAQELQSKASDARCALDQVLVELGKLDQPKCVAGQLIAYAKSLMSPPKTPEAWLELSNKILLDLEARVNKAKGGV